MLYRFIKENKISLGLFLVTIISRIPFASKYFYDWDAAQFGMGTKLFDVTQHQPHPPGYIIYVFLGKLLSFFMDTNTAFVVISIVFSGLTVVILYNLFKLIFKSNTFAIIGGLILASNPYFWFYGEIAHSYVFDAFFSILLVYFSFRIIKFRNIKDIYYLSFWLALSGGIRQSILVLFIPIWIYVMIFSLKNKVINLRRLLYSLIIIILTIGAWFIPLLFLSGGWSEYWEVTNFQMSSAASTSSILSGVPWSVVFDNTVTIVKVSLAIIGILPLLWLVILFYRPQVKIKLLSFIKNSYFHISLLWFLISYLFYILIHFGQPGYLMTVIGWLVIILIYPLKILIGNQKVWAAWLIVLVIISFSTCSFLFFNRDFGNDKLNGIKNDIYHFNTWYGRYTNQNINIADTIFQSYIEKISEYDANTTAVVSLRGFNYRLQGSDEWQTNIFDIYRHFQFYLSEYNPIQLLSGRNFYYQTNVANGLDKIYSHELNLAIGINKVLIISDGIDKEYIEKYNIREIALPHNKKIFELELTDDRPVIYDYVF